ncbi:MAG TPA: DUF2809 domain-containing protein [Gemmataceae bacterium]|nr:DUF2809 domain-containing protein [Gemmataceae bacterium]
MPRLLAALVVTLALGLLSRLHPVGFPLWDKWLGDVFYAVAAYLALALLLIRARPSLIPPLALAACFAVEAFKTTGLPARYVGFAVVRWLLGTTFSWYNLVCYVAGVAAITVADVLLLRPGRWRGKE